MVTNKESKFKTLTIKKFNGKEIKLEIKPISVNEQIEINKLAKDGKINDENYVEIVKTLLINRGTITEEDANEINFLDFSSIAMILLDLKQVTLTM